MLKNPNYVYGTKDIIVPSDLHLGRYLLNQMMEFKDTEIINGLTHELVNFGQLAQQSMNLAVSLSRLGLRKGDRVALCSENRTEFLSSVIGTVLGGAVLTTVNLTYTKGELSHVMGISKPKYLICSPIAYKTHEKTFKSLKYLEKIIVFSNDFKGVIYFNDLVTNDVKLEDFEAVDVEGQNDVAFILYSSGTTGLPKGVMLTHLNCLNSLCGTSVEYPFTPIFLSVNPWFHVFGLMVVLTAICCGRITVYLPRFEMDLYLRTIEKYKVTIILVVPPVLVALTRTEIKYDISSVMIVYCSAAPLRSEVSKEVQKLFPNAYPVFQGYGFTESTFSVTKNINLVDDKPGCVGGATATAVIKIVDTNTREALGPNKEGEICVKGGSIMKGYVGKDRREDFDDEGFFKTGDIGYYDEERNFYIVERLKELIKYKGFQVPPAEIEAVLLQHPAVRDAGVVGVPDSRAGEVPRAFVALQAGATTSEKELQDFVAERLSNPKWLRGGVFFVSEIPKNPSGKILRCQLKAMVESGVQGKSKL